MQQGFNAEVNLGFQKIDVTAAQGLTIPAGASMALIVPDTQTVMWRDDGTNPTAAIGMPLAVGQALYYTGQLAKFKAISSTGAANINVSYYA